MSLGQWWEEAKARSLPVLDATCPLVSKVHHQGKHYVAKGRTLILIGHAGHPEVEGTMGQIDGPVHLVSHEADVAALDLPLDTPLAYVTQTTLSVDDTKDVIIALKARFTDVSGPDIADICYATQNRQTAVRDLCKVVDALIVVGGQLQLQLQTFMRNRQRDRHPQLFGGRRQRDRRCLDDRGDQRRPHRRRLGA